MAVNGISGLGITGTLSNGSFMTSSVQKESEQKNFMNLVKEMTAKASSKDAHLEGTNLSGVASSQISSGKRVNGDYTKGFHESYTSESDKNAKPRGFAANSTNSKGKQPVIDRTSELYEQSMEMENYLVKMMLSSMRSTIEHTSLSGDQNSYAREMYEDMMYDNYAEELTKSAGLGLADQIYIELSGQRA